MVRARSQLCARAVHSAETSGLERIFFDDPARPDASDELVLLTTLPCASISATRNVQRAAAVLDLRAVSTQLTAQRQQRKAIELDDTESIR